MSQPSAVSPSSSHFTALFTASETERYARHFALPGMGVAGQEKLKAARVLIVGVGGLGSPAALYLAAAGVGTLGLMDFDRVQLSNLQRQILFSMDDLEHEKAGAARARLAALNPDIQVMTITEKLTAANARRWIAQFDVIVDGSDNFQTRYAVNEACVEENKPLVFGAVARFDAQMAVFNWRGGPCYRCLYPAAPGVESVGNCAEAGVLGALPGTVGTLMATEVLKILIGLGVPLSGEVLTYDALNTQFLKLRFTKRTDCESCGTQKKMRPSPASIKEIGWEEIHALGNSALILDVRSGAELEALPLSDFSARHIPLAVLSAQLADGSFPFGEMRSNHVIAICQSGVRSARAAELLQIAGVKNVAHVPGGLNGRASHPVVPRGS